MYDDISLDTIQHDTLEEISLAPENSRTPLSSEVAKKRAFKAQTALPELSSQEVENRLLTGEENMLRSKAALAEDQRKNEVANKVILDLIRARGGKPLSYEENKFVMDQLSSANNASDPASVFEEQYATWLTDSLDRNATNNVGTNYEDAKQQIPEYVGAAKQTTLDINRKREFLNTMIENAQSVYADQSYIGTAVDFAKLIIPFYGTAKMRGNVSGTGLFTGGLLGQNLEAQMNALMIMPFPEFKKELTRIYNGLTQDNPGLAVQFLTAMKGQSSSEVFLNGVFDAIELSMVPGYFKSIKGVYSSAKLASDTRNAMKNLIKTSEGVDVSKSGVATASGDITEAGVQKTVDNVRKEYNGLSTPTMEAIEALPSHMKVYSKDVRDNPGRFSAEIVNRIAESMEVGANKLLYTLAQMNRPDRVPALESVAKAAFTDMLKEKYPRTSSMIMDISAPFKEPLSGVRFQYMDLMRADGKLWAKETNAKNAIAHLGLRKAVIEKQGDMFFIRAIVPIDETHPVVRNTLLTSPDNQLPRSFSTGFWDRIRTPEDTMTKENVRNRKLATYGTSVIEKVIDEQAKKIRDLARGIVRTDPVTGEKIGFVRRNATAWSGIATRTNKQRYDEWLRMVNAEKEMIDEATKVPGRDFKSPFDIEQFYMTNFGRMPDAIEVEAYFAHKTLKEYDAILREIQMYSLKARRGAELHSFKILGPNGRGTLESPKFEGIRMGQMPGGDESIVVVGPTADHMRLYNLSGTATMSPQTRTKLNKEVLEGKKIVIRIFDPESRPLAGFASLTGNNRPRYVVLNSVKTEPLQWSQLPRRGGGHFDYDYDFYIKQAIVRPDKVGNTFAYWYEGDVTVMPMMLRAQGRSVITHLENVRLHLKKGDIPAAKKYAEDNLPIPWEDLHGWFKPAYAKGGERLPARLSLDEPFQLVERNKLIVDMDSDLANRYKDKKGKNLFRDGTKEGSDARSAAVEYTGQRDAYEIYTITDKGTRNNPLFAMDKAQFLDPIASMNRALKRITSSTFLNDYKSFSVESWLRQASKYLDVKAGQIEYSPNWVFHHHKWLPGAPPEFKAQMENQKWQIEQLLGTPSQYDTFLHSAASRLSDQLYESFGPNALKGPLDPMWLLPKLANPWGFIRGATFHAKLGLFAIPQLLVQSQTYAAIFAIAGAKHASQGTAGALLTQYARINSNPKILEALDKAATKMGWRKGEFIESLEELRLSGFGNVAGEYAQIDAAFSPTLFHSRGRTFLDAGKFFFTEGERGVRYGAWHTAFREYRATVKPTGKLTDIDKAKILDRADMLSINMSRASSSLLHTGIMSFPAQFLSYQMRLAEIFWGKRLGDTVKERSLARARLAMWYAGLYGVPSTIGLTGLPIADSIRQASIEKGYTHGENELTSLVNEGIPSFLAAFISGNGDIKKGNWFNINERYGVQGLEQVNEVFRGDKPWWTLLGGAAFSTFSGAFEGSDGFRTAMMSWIRGDGKAFPFVMDDFVDMFREISSVHSAERLRMAANTGRWLSKKGGFLGEVSPSLALFQTVTGLQSQSISDMYLQTLSMKQVEEDQKKGFNLAIKEFRKGIRAMESDPNLGDDHLRRAFKYLIAYGYPEEKYPGFISLASKGHEPLTQHINWQFYVEKLRPGADVIENMETYRTRTNIERKTN